MGFDLNRLTSQEAANAAQSFVYDEKVVTFDGTSNNGKIAAAAALTTALTGANNDIVYTADANGAAGNDISIEYVDSGEPGTALDVSVDGTAITVVLERESVETADLTTALTGDDNDLVFTAREEGAAGNSITVAYVDPSANDAELSLEVTGTDIVVSLATGPAGAITTTAQEVLELVNYDHDAQALVTASLAASNDGTGVVTALTETALTGGQDGDIVTTADEVKTAIAGEASAAALVNTADAGGNDGSGVVTEMAATNLAGGSDGWVELFTVPEDMNVTVWGTCQTSLAGATATLTVGYTANTDAFLASTTATDVDAGEHFDITGLLAAEVRPAAVPAIFVQGGTAVRAYVGTADVTDGKITFHLVAERPHSTYV